MSINKTTRTPGPIDPIEVERFQVRYGIKVDGEFGHQSLGQVEEVENAYRTLSTKYVDVVKKYAALLAKPDPKPSVAGYIAGLITLMVVWLLGVLDWVRGLFV